MFHHGLKKSNLFGFLDIFLCAAMTVSGAGCSQSNANKPTDLKLLSYNIWYCFNEQKELEAGNTWMANCGADVIAIEEMLYVDEPGFQAMAKKWGYPYAVLLKPGTLSIGLCSRKPMENVIRQIDNMHHGMIYAKIDGVHYVVTHLSPFKYEVRREETRVIANLIKPFIDNNEPVVVMGDFNTPSPVDAAHVNNNQKLLDTYAEIDRTHSDYAKNLENGKYEFQAFQTLLDLPLYDAGTVFAENGKTIDTYPTNVGSSSPLDKLEQSYRIDFILVSKPMLDRLKSYDVIMDPVTEKLSDHYPIQAEFVK